MTAGETAAAGAPARTTSAQHTSNTEATVP